MLDHGSNLNRTLDKIGQSQKQIINIKKKERKKKKKEKSLPHTVSWCFWQQPLNFPMSLDGILDHPMRNQTLPLAKGKKRRIRWPIDDLS